MKNRQSEKISSSKKEEKKLVETIKLRLISSAITYGLITIDELKTKSMDEIRQIIFDTLDASSNEDGDTRCTIIYLEEILSEAKILEKKQKFRLAIIFYAMWIEHYFNEIIQSALMSKQTISGKEIMNIMRLDIESKRTWLLPLIGLPRLSENCAKTMKKLFDKRNEFMHYKWNGKFSDEMDKDNQEYISLCKKASSAISCLKRYKTKNLFTDSKIKKILDEKVKTHSLR